MLVYVDCIGTLSAAQDVADDKWESNAPTWRYPLTSTPKIINFFKGSKKSRKQAREISLSCTEALRGLFRNTKGRRNAVNRRLFVATIDAPSFLCHITHASEYHLSPRSCLRSTASMKPLLAGLGILSKKILLPRIYYT